MANPIAVVLALLSLAINPACAFSNLVEDRNMHKPLTVLILTLLLTACGGGGGDSDTTSSNNDAEDTNNNSESESISNDDTDATQTSALANNTWNQCNEFAATSSEFPQIFGETTYVAKTNTYLNNNCSGAPDTSSEVTSGTYTIGKSVVTTGGFNATEIDFHVTGAFGEELPEEAHYTLYDIYYIDNDVLYYGDLRGESESNRPDTINFDDAYIQEN
jgi:hypothetical protein